MTTENDTPTVTLDGAQIIARATALYRMLPRAGFTPATFEELGAAARLGVVFAALSIPLKRTLFTLIREFSDELARIELAEAIAAGQEVQQEAGPPSDPGGEAGDPPNEAPTNGDPKPAEHEEDVPPVPPSPEPSEQPAVT